MVEILILKELGVKKYGGQICKYPGNILIRQRGNKFKLGNECCPRQRLYYFFHLIDGNSLNLI